MNKKIDFQKLFEEKKYTKILSIIQNIDKKNLNSGLINLSGVCKILSDKSEVKVGPSESMSKSKKNTSGTKQNLILI